VPGDTITISRPAWLTQEIEWSATQEGGESMKVSLEPRVVNALRVSRYVAMDAELFDAHLEMAASSSINAFVFDTKDESGQVLYETAVAEADTLGAVNPIYDPTELIGMAKEAGLYTITRIVSFEDPIRVKADPDTKLRGAWVDPTNSDHWEYYLQLATEACELGFDEIQFDYVRFPAGLTGAALAGTFTADERVDAVGRYLAEGVARLHPLGCAVSADVFGIIFSSPTDEGIGQRVEEVTAIVDVVSPMLYPSHYSNGWLGFADPNDHPGPVIADALDDGAPRLAPTVIVRPWLQAFYYVPSQILAEIDEASQRGLGWMLWNAGGNYSPDALPAEPVP
ncbi:MAG: putative glycoside hydrolase, partial [Acidimicrobiia bacterium]